MYCFAMGSSERQRCKQQKNARSVRVPFFVAKVAPRGGVETGQVISGTDVALQTGKSQAIATLLALPHEAGEIYRHCRSRSDL